MGVALALAAATVALPQTSRAGWFSSLLKFLTGAPAEVEERLPPLAPASWTAVAASALGVEGRPPPAAVQDDHGDPALTVVEEHAILAPLNPAGTIADEVSPAGLIFLYTVRPGDTISGIAQSFNVSVNTILWANAITNPRSLAVGSQLLILPVSGVRHEVQKGDTLSAIARRYRASIEDIAQFNGLAPDGDLAVGTVVIVPSGELPQAAPLVASGTAPSRFSNLPLHEGYYLRPIEGGRRSRGTHGYNGVDLASACGGSVFASADGQLLIARSSGWNGGYGRYVVISHPNNTQTLYAHLRDLTVVPGGLVRQGEVIGTIGSSGNSTGCHVHFEIRGARNPF